MYKFLIPLLSIITIGCQNNNKSKNNDTIGPGIPDTVVQTQVIDTSLTGIYQVKLPCSDCAGREHTLALYSDGGFRLQEIFLGKSLAPAVTRGKWWRNGDEVQLMDGNVVINTYELHQDTLFVKSPEADSYNYPRFPLRRMNSLVPASWTKYKDSSVVFMAAGTEPFWGLKIRTDRSISFSRAGQNEVVVKGGQPIEHSDSTIYKSKAGKGSFKLTIYPQFCSDGMSDIIYQYRVMLQYDTLYFKGCGSYLE